MKKVFKKAVWCLTALVLLLQPVPVQAADCTVRISVQVQAAADSASIEQVKTEILFEALDGAPAAGPEQSQMLTGEGTLDFTLTFSEPGSYFYEITQSLPENGTATAEGAVQLESNPIVLRVDVISENGILQPVMYGYRDQETAGSDTPETPQEKVSDLVFTVRNPRQEPHPDKDQDSRKTDSSRTSARLGSQAGWIFLMAAAVLVILGLIWKSKKRE